MLGRFLAIRKAERRDTWAAFFMLFGLISSHAVLETARDALFLASVPATRLPWVYVGIAAISLVVSQLQLRFGEGLNRRRALMIWTGGAAALTFGFWLTLDAFGDWDVYALYIWSGVLTTAVLVHFWVLLGSLFSITQAKRVYGLIGTGSVLGAIVGTGVASVMAQLTSAVHLLLLSSVGLAATAVVPVLFHDRASDSGRAEAAKERHGLWESANYVARQPYARRVVLLFVVATACLTVADYIFKSTVAAHVPAADLGRFFSSVYFLLNLLSLAAQVWLVAALLRRFDLSVAMAVLPTLLLVGGIGMMAFGGLAAALLIKGADGGLRYSLHRTTNELLFVPLSEASRARVKSFIDVVGQRGGQVLASAGILGVVLSEAHSIHFSIALLVLGGLWLGGAADLRRFYLDLFRRRLSRGDLGLGAFPDLDVESLETLIATLDSEDDAEVLAALEVIEREGRARLVPALILYHPSEAVVERALDLFVRTGRTNASHQAERLLDHSSARVRAAAVAAISVLSPDERMLKKRLTTEASPEVRATIMVNLLASGAMADGDGEDALQSILEQGSRSAKTALAEAIARRHAKAFESALIALARDDDPEVRLAAARAMTDVRSDALLDALTGLMAYERCRDVARRNLAAYGSRGLDSDMPSNLLA